MTRIIYTSESRWAVMGLFNGNAFPETLENLVNASAERTAMLRYQIENLSKIISRDKEDFAKHFLKEINVHIKASKDRPELNLEAHYDGIECLSSLHGILYSLKSFLDI